MCIRQGANITGCGTVFSTKKQGFVPAIMEYLFNKRQLHSKEEEKWEKIAAADKSNKKAREQSDIFANRSLAIKYLLNSGYGALSNEFYRFFDDNVAESFTLSGQFAIKSVERYVNRNMNQYLGTEDVDYTIAIDTDSCYFSMDKVVRDKYDGDDPVTFLEEFSDIIQGWIKEALELLYKQTNAFSKNLSMSLESIGPAIWVAKKRYVMSLPSFKKIRYNPPKIKVMGIEAVRSTTPQIVREWMNEAIPIALDGDDLKIKKYIDDKWLEFCDLPFASIAMPKGTNDLEKYMGRDGKVYGERTPIHVRGALLFNHYVKQKGLDKEIDLLKSGDKVKFMYLKLPNPLMENVISTPDDLPEDMNEINNYIDYQTQFDKTFLIPIKRITDAAGISLSSNVSMDDFYG